jgi:hypothetical protein
MMPSTVDSVDETTIHNVAAARACRAIVLLQAWRPFVHVFAHQNFEQTANVPMLLA